ncbi:serine hydrolase domain-containing protein [Streptomyces paradoxus]|uniref:serine hydrolase domain-containing protein n=1 Tax=Streptomyces paradoxus TaxID=66375 RepID=UPI00380FB9D8
MRTGEGLVALHGETHACRYSCRHGEEGHSHRLPSNVLLRSIVSDFLRDSHDQPGVLAALNGPGIDWSGAAGVADLVDGRPLGPAAAVRVASVTKTFTAAAVLRLVESGRLGLDDPITPLTSGELIEALGEGGYRTGRMTVRQLLQHTAGLYDWGTDPDYDREAFARPAHRWTRLEQVRWAVAHGRPLADPGTEFHYSDTGYILLGDILERVTGTSLAAAYRTLLDFERLGLESVHLESLETAPEGAADRAHQYSAGTDLLAVDPSCDLWGGGGLVSTMRDLALFVRALFAGEVFEHRSTLARMLEPVPARGAEGRGTGIFRLPLGPGVWWGHPGFWGVVMAYSPEHDLAVATTVTRRPEEHPDERYEIGRRLVRAVCDRTVSAG